MTEFDEQGFWEATRREDKAASRLNEAQLELEMRLGAHGECVELTVGATATEEEQVYALIETKKRQSTLLTLAAHLCMLRVVEEGSQALPPTEASQIKKTLQKQLIIEGRSDAWLKVVDEAFPGESLQDDDFADLPDLLSQHEEQIKVYQQQFRGTREAMAKFMGRELSPRYAAPV